MLVDTSAEQEVIWDKSFYAEWMAALANPQSVKPAAARVPKTDQEIYQAAMEEWLGVLTQLWTAYDKPLDSSRLELYQKMLGDVPLGLLDKAIKRVIREHKYNSVPAVGDVWSAIRKELGNPHDIDQAIQAWCAELSPIIRFEKADGNE
jgi:hypothetical protein